MKTRTKVVNLLLFIVGMYLMAMTCAWAFDADHMWRVERGYNRACTFACVCNGEIEMKTLADFILFRQSLLTPNPGAGQLELAPKELI